MAEALLYRHIIITNARAPQMLLLQGTLLTKRRPNGAPAATWTRKITVAELPPRESDLDAGYHTTLRDVVLLCPNLESFCVYGRPRDRYGFPETTKDMFKTLPDHLRMCAWADLGETVQLGLFRDSCSFFSRLEHLQLRRMWGYIDEEVILTLPRLRSLSFASWITNYPIARWELPSLVWLEISVESAVWLESLDSFFSEHGKKLEFLQLVPGDRPPPRLNLEGVHRLHSIEIPLNFFRYFPLLSCFSVDPSWMRLLGIIEQSDGIPVLPHKNLTTLHILRPDPRHGPHISCSEFVHSFFVAHQNVFPRLKDVSFTLKEKYIVVPMSHPWFLSGNRPTREELASLRDGFSFDIADHAYF
jgi:hypothetical protein